MPRKITAKYVDRVVTIATRRARGETQEAIARDLKTTVRSISRSERAVRLGLLPDDALSEAIKAAYEATEQEKLRVKLFGMLTRLAVARARQVPRRRF